MINTSQRAPQMSKYALPNPVLRETDSSAVLPPSDSERVPFTATIPTQKTFSEFVPQKASSSDEILTNYPLSSTVLSVPNRRKGSPPGTQNNNNKSVTEDGKTRNSTYNADEALNVAKSWI